ncbi:MAG TPA: LysE family translocator [Variovorax sp.]|jgi:threonine/homoserine/homoserine lactone efflux protein
MLGNVAAIDGLTGFVLTAAVLIAVPGPSVMFLVGQTMTVGRGNALRGVIGNAIGTYLVALIVAAGMGALLMHSSQALTVIRLLGATALLAIGCQYMFFSEPWEANREAGPTKRRQALLAGIVVGATNPKALIMFGVIVPSFMSAGADSPASSLLGFSLIPIGLGLCMDTAWVMGAHALSSSHFFTGKAVKWFHVIGGGLVACMGILLAMESLPMAD